MRIKANIEELTAYAKIHQDYVLQNKENIVLDFFERQEKFDPQKPEHAAATGSFNDFLAFKRNQPNAIADLSSLKLEDLNLSDCDFTESIFSGTSISGCIFANSNFMRADLTNSTVTESLFASANLDDAKLDKAIISGCDFTTAKYNKDTFQKVADQTKLASDNIGLNL